jgi:putative transcriptional regulator
MALYRRFTLKKKKAPSKLTEAILEMADDMHRSGIMDNSTYQKITMRHLGKKVLSTSEPISGPEIRRLRKQEHLSQAVFARYLNLTTGYVSQLERGAKQPKGPALALLNVIRHKGFEAIL